MGKIITLLQSAFYYICRHKYLITISAFLIIIVFLDENNLIRRFEHKREIHSLNEEIAKYRKMYEEDTERLNELSTNPEAIEKIAREKYLMKNPNEDIYIFEEEN
jgi:cell division protein DivIC